MGHAHGITVSDKPSTIARHGVADAGEFVRRDLQLKLYIALGVHALVLAWLLVVPVGKATVSALANIGLPLVACWWSVFVGRRLRLLTPAPQADPQVRSRRWSCWLMALGTLSYALGSVGYYYYSFAGESPFPSVADVIYFCAYPLQIPAVLLIATRATSGAVRGRLLFDSLLTITGLATFSWHFLLGPILRDGSDSMLATIYSASYPVFDLGLLFCALAVAGRLSAGERRRIAWPLGVGMALLVLADTVWGYGMQHGTYEVGGPIDIAWSLGYMLIGLAARAHLLAPYMMASSGVTAVSPVASAPANESRDAMSLYHAMAPYALLPMVVGLIVYSHHTQSDPWLRYGVYLGSAALVGLLFLRQVFSIHENVQLNRRLTTVIHERAELNDRLIASSRRAGMAEVASGVLHNVGNVLNSINVSASIAQQALAKSEVGSLHRVGELIAQHPDDFGAYVSADPRGRQLPAFIVELAKVLTDERRLLVSEVANLAEGIEHLKQIIDAQQTHARCGVLCEDVAPSTLMDAAVTMQAISIANHQIRIVRQYASVPSMSVERHKVLQILMNLISNAKEAVKARGGAIDRTIILTVDGSSIGRVRFVVYDNGIGIAPNQITQVFAHGFTTKKSGHGFGLHSAANLAREMGGSLTATSDGLNLGATFTLDLPLSNTATQPTTAVTARAA